MSTVHAASNPDLANALLDKATSPEPAENRGPEILAPWDSRVSLPGGYISPTGELLASVEVRELNGKDEEALGKMKSAVQQYFAILSRGAVSIGGEPVTEDILDGMLVGDRDAVVLGIYKATFGPDIDYPVYCEECGDITVHNVNVDDDIPVRRLDRPMERTFEVKGRRHTMICGLPTGVAQKAALSNLDRSDAEMTSDVLMATIMEIDGAPVVSKSQVLDLGIADRRAVSEELTKKNPGPQVQQSTGTCNSCGGKSKVAVSISDIFRI